MAGRDFRRYPVSPFQHTFSVVNSGTRSNNSSNSELSPPVCLSKNDLTSDISKNASLMLRARLPERCRDAVSQTVLITICLMGRGSLATVIRLPSQVSDNKEVTADEKEAPPRTSTVTSSFSCLTLGMDTPAAP